MGATEIPNYEPPDKGWGIVVGPVIRLKPEDERDDVADSDVEHDRQ